MNSIFRKSLMTFGVTIAVVLLGSFVHANAPTEENIARTGKQISGLIEGGGGRVEDTPMTAQEAMQVLAELGRPGMELTDEQRARLAAANETLYGARK